jgi:hypothetical protein
MSSWPILLVCAYLTAYVQSAYRPYCDGTPTHPAGAAYLYREPPCEYDSIARPLLPLTVNYTAFAVRGLQFCCMSNYTAVLPYGTNLTEKDREAAAAYRRLEKFLQRVDCDKFYPFHSCEPCLYAYRSWLCATMLPLKCGGMNEAIKVCDEVCMQVVRKCPAAVGFHCTKDDQLYGSWSGGPAAVGGGGCNPMQYNLGAAAHHGVAVLSIAVVLLSVCL